MTQKMVRSGGNGGRTFRPAPNCSGLKRTCAIRARTAWQLVSERALSGPAETQVRMDICEDAQVAKPR